MMLLGVAILAVTAHAGDSAADVLTLRDGRILLGQVVEKAPNGSIKVVVRRAWAEATLPDLFRRWKTVEAGPLNLARKQRRERLAAWRRDRAQAGDPDDFVCDWIDSEWKRLGRPFDPSEAPLMVVALSRADLKSTAIRGELERRLLRLAWVEGINAPEDMTVDELKTAMKRAQVSGIGDEPPPIEELLPDPPEIDNRWRLRRAATEALHDNGLRFIRYETLVLPEGQEPAADDAQKALGGLLGGLLGDLNPPRTDPLLEKLQGLERRGKIGAIVTRLNLGPRTEIESTLWVRAVRGDWVPAVVEKAEARPDQGPENAGATLADDPQVKAVFGLLDGLGLGGLGEDAKRISLRSGAAVQQALGESRIALQDRLRELALPVRGSIRPRPAEAP